MLPNPTIFGLEIEWYSAFHYLGLFLTILFGILYYKRRYSSSYSPLQLLVLLGVTSICLLVGSRLMGMVEFYVSTNLWPDPSIILQSPSKGQFRWCGSVAAIFLFVPLVNKILGIKHQNYLDVLAVALLSLIHI